MKTRSTKPNKQNHSEKNTRSVYHKDFTQVLYPDIVVFTIKKAPLNERKNKNKTQRQHVRKNAYVMLIKSLINTDGVVTNVRGFFVLNNNMTPQNFCEQL